MTGELKGPRHNAIGQIDDRGPLPYLGDAMRPAAPLPDGRMVRQKVDAEGILYLSIEGQR